MVNYNMRLAAALRLRYGCHVALVQTGGDSYLLARDGRVGRAHDNQAPVVRLLQSEPRTCKSKMIFTSHVPNHAEKGMARMCGVRSIGYLQGPTERWHDMRRSGYSDTPQTGTTLGYRDWFNRPQLERNRIVGWLRNQNVRYQWAESGRGRQGAGTTGPDARRLITDLGSLASHGIDQTARDTVGMLLAFAVVEAVHGRYRNNPQRGRGYHGQNIGGVLVAGDGRLLAWGVNTNLGNTTLHGEVNIVQCFQSKTGGAQLPSNGTLYTTLEPCEMCAGMLHVTTPGNFRVVCGQDDPNLGWTALRNGSKGNMMSTTRGPILPGVTWADLLAARLGASGTFATRFLEQGETGTLLGDAHVMLHHMAKLYLSGDALARWRQTLAAFLQSVRGGMGG